MQHRAGNAAVARALDGPTAGPVVQRSPQAVVQRAPRTADSVSIVEGEVKVAQAGEPITYPGVDSCLTITATLADGSRVGAHASLMQMGSGYPSDRILAAIGHAVGNQRIDYVELRGDLDSWHPDFFDEGYDSRFANSTPMPTGTPAPGSLASKVAAALGVAAGAVSEVQQRGTIRV
ncbi:hypothetical protein [Streptomyces lonarensis]|uniref:Uncharacterized protein n=1 Tax=Streptomyces lonarensis TaxID=700599 RepID=A0A7X6HZ35_9ACTN|nr:hypothetical protein [Streptomyces lonarensis]NJQ06253.1 hypothetical protein [Streptomyces lonarensis]